MGVKLREGLRRACCGLHHSPNKVKDALRLGADEVVNSKNEDDMKKQAQQFPFHSRHRGRAARHQRLPRLLKRDGILTQVGVPAEPLSVHVSSLIFGRKSFTGSLIGGIKETQEMLDFCGEAQHHFRHRTHSHPENE
jgi:uncharacterized zinc-type alcohol dehydrogenase-like protein